MHFAGLPRVLTWRFRARVVPFQTLSTLQFADRARQVMVRARVNAGSGSRVQLAEAKVSQLHQCYWLHCNLRSRELTHTMLRAGAFVCCSEK